MLQAVLDVSKVMTPEQRVKFAERMKITKPECMIGCGACSMGTMER